jgi:hypothetical protein
MPDAAANFEFIGDSLSDEVIEALAALLLANAEAERQNHEHQGGEPPAQQKTRRATAGQRPLCDCISDPEKENAYVHSMPPPGHLGIADRD